MDEPQYFCTHIYFRTCLLTGGRKPSLLLQQTFFLNATIIIMCISPCSNCIMLVAYRLILQEGKEISFSQRMLGDRVKWAFINNIIIHKCIKVVILLGELYYESNLAMPVYCCYSYKNWSFTNPEMFKSALVWVCRFFEPIIIVCALVYNNTD